MAQTSSKKSFRRKSLTRQIDTKTTKAKNARNVSPPRQLCGGASTGDRTPLLGPNVLPVTPIKTVTSLPSKALPMGLLIATDRRYPHPYFLNTRLGRKKHYSFVNIFLARFIVYIIYSLSSGLLDNNFNQLYPAEACFSSSIRNLV